MTKLSVSEQIVVGHHFAEWTDDMSFEEIIEGYRNDDEMVGVWEPFEDWGKEDFIAHIVGLEASIAEALLSIAEEAA
jgi:hypothetical protein